MHLTTFLSTTALALTANAFTSLSEEINADIQAIEAQADNATKVVSRIVDHNSQGVKLDCASCPFALKSERNGAHEWTNDVESDLIMQFAAKDSHLTLNGKPFYPVSIQEMPGLLFAPQVKKISSPKTGFEGYEKDLKLSYTLEFQGEKAEDGNTAVGMVMTILGIDGQMVRIDNVKIEAIKHADGSLSLAKVWTIAPSPSDPDAKCTNMMCRLVTKLSSAISTARAKAAAAAHSTAHAAKKIKCFCMRCFHRVAGHPQQAAAPSGSDKPSPDDYEGEDGHPTQKLPTHNHVVPGHFRPHHGGHHHGFLHKTLRFARHLFTFVLLPVVVGVIVGMTASAIGMLLGQAVVFLWMKYRRSGGRQGAYEVVQTDDKEDSLPAYDEEGLPAYTEDTAVVVADEKEEENKT